MLSWRYRGHPQAGGAELMTHEILRRCVAAGWEVSCLTAGTPGERDVDEIDGVRVVRAGRQWTVQAHAFRWLRRHLSHFDRVIEQTNTLPFMTPLYVPAARRRLFIHQLAREYWFRETRGAFRLGAPVGYAVEPAMMRLYRRTPTITVSESSRADLEALGIPVVAVVPQAVATPAVPEPGPRRGPLRLIALGRLTPAKFVEESIEAFGLVQAAVPDAELDVVGSGDPAYQRRLERLVGRLDLRNVTFRGHVSEDHKRELLERAHVHVFTSHREGWGLTVTEAARVGTPSVGYDVPGVRDSIGDLRLLASARTPAAIAERVLELHRDPGRYESTRRAAWERARGLNWDDTAAAFMEAVR